MKIGNCYLTYSPFLKEHLVSTECKKPETAIKRFTAVLCEVMAGCTERFDFGSLVRDTFNSPDSYSFDNGSFRRCFSCVDSGLMFDTTVSLTLTFHNGVYLLCIAFTSFDKIFTSSDEDTKDTTEDTKDTTEDTIEDTKDTTALLPVPLWFYQRANIYIWSAVLAAYKCWYYCDRRKRVFVKPVRIVPHGCYPVLISPYGMPADYYPYKMLVDGSEVWDCRSRSYNEYLSDLIGAPPYDQLPF